MTERDPRPHGCRDCADSDGFCCNDPKGPNCGFDKGHPLHRTERFRPTVSHDDGYGEPMDDDVPIMAAKDFHGDRPLGTPISELSGQPGDPRNPNDPRHVGYENFKRIARSWGFD